MMERTGSRSMRSVSSFQERHTEVEPWPSRSLAATPRGGDASFLRTLALLRAGAADAPAAVRPPAAVSISAGRRTRPQRTWIATFEPGGTNEAHWRPDDRRVLDRGRGRTRLCRARTRE